jgi:hypothetical protein
MKFEKMIIKVPGNEYYEAKYIKMILKGWGVKKKKNLQRKKNGGVFIGGS